MRIGDWSSDVCSSDLPDLCARRLQFWAAHAPLILSSTDLIYRSRVLNTLARGARHIDRVADKQPVGVRRIATWAGILTAGLLIPGGDARRAVGETGIAKALAVSVFDDGGIVSRSPRDQVRSEEHTSELQSLMLISYA